MRDVTEVTVDEWGCVLTSPDIMMVGPPLCRPEQAAPAPWPPPPRWSAPAPAPACPGLDAGSLWSLFWWVCHTLLWLILQSVRHWPPAPLALVSTTDTTPPHHYQHINTSTPSLTTHTTITDYDQNHWQVGFSKITQINDEYLLISDWGSGVYLCPVWPEARDGQYQCCSKVLSAHILVTSIQGWQQQMGGGGMVRPI